MTLTQTRSTKEMVIGTPFPTSLEQMERSFNTLMQWVIHTTLCLITLDDFVKPPFRMEAVRVMHMT